MSCRRRRNMMVVVLGVAVWRRFRQGNTIKLGLHGIGDKQDKGRKRGGALRLGAGLMVAFENGVLTLRNIRAPFLNSEGGNKGMLFWAPYADNFYSSPGENGMFLCKFLSTIGEPHFWMQKRRPEMEQQYLHVCIYIHIKKLMLIHLYTYMLWSYYLVQVWVFWKLLSGPSWGFWKLLSGPSLCF